MDLEKRIRYALKSRGLKEPTLKSLRERLIGVPELKEFSSQTGLPIAFFLGELDEIEGFVINYHRFLMDDNNLAQYCDCKVPYGVKIVIGSIFAEIRKHSSRKIHVDMDHLLCSVFHASTGGKLYEMVEDRKLSAEEERERTDILYVSFLNDRQIPDFNRKVLPDKRWVPDRCKRAIDGLYRTYCEIVIHGNY
jgi:hypothetical protein